MQSNHVFGPREARISSNRNLDPFQEADCEQTTSKMKKPLYLFCC